MESLKVQRAKARKGQRMIIAANRIAFGERIARQADDLAARNAYRLACGLPLIEPGNGLFTKEHKGD